jgi:predicted acylesterase/phospholipase RssA
MSNITKQRRHARTPLRFAGWHLLACLCLLTAAGCTTQDTRSLVGPVCGERFQECPVRLEAYRPVQDRADGQDPTLAVAVAISGGGHRAGNFGAGVLLGLEEITREAGGPSPAATRPARPANALREVDYLSTASGGGLAAAAYVASLRDYCIFHGSAEGYSFAAALGDPRAPAAGGGKAQQDVQCEFTDPGLRTSLQYNYVQDMVHGLFSLASIGAVHRGDFLENAFDDHILGRLWREDKLKSLASAPAGGPAIAPADNHDGLRLSDIFVPRQDATRPVRVPYWVANATTYENAAIFPFTPDHLKLYQIIAYTHRLRRVHHQAGEDYDRFTSDAPVALGLTASGCFPVLIPAIGMESSMDPDNRYLNLLDGGLADNFGATSAVRMLREDQVAKRKVLIVVDAFNGPLTPFSNIERSPAMVATAFRITTAGLDASRSRYHEVIRGLCDSNSPQLNIQVIFLSFDDLLDCKDISVLEPYGFGPKDLEQLKLEGLTLGLEITPFRLGRDVWTWYSLSAAQQKLMLALGRCVVARKKDDIRQALGWAEAGATTRPAATNTTAK